MIFRTCASYFDAQLPQCDDAGDRESTRSELSAATTTTNKKLTPLFAKQNLHDIPVDKMMQLSAQDRSEGFYDLHGVSTPLVKETRIMIDEKCDEMDLELVLVENRSAYLMALDANRTYVQGLRLRFLRAENFDAVKAAQRMALHFDFRLKMFGPNVLGRDILLSDLPELDRSLNEKGFMQVCPERDRVGRAVEIQMMRKLGTEPPAESAARLFFFWMQYLGNQEQTQRKGVVLIEYMVGVKVEQLLNTKRRARNPLFLWVIASMPVRLNALHVCFDDPRIKTLFSLLTSMIEAKLLCRLQSHFGSDMECMFSLLAYGIPPSTLPVLPDGRIDTTVHDARLRELATLQEGEILVDKSSSLASSEETAEGQSVQATPEDVLLGRGKHGKKWPGNLRLRKLVDSRYDAYAVTDRDGKIAISNQIYDEMVRSGVRFLVPRKVGSSSPSESEWVKMPRREVCIRIAHLFRNVRAAERSSFGTTR